LILSRSISLRCLANEVTLLLANITSLILKTQNSCGAAVSLLPQCMSKIRDISLFPLIDEILFQIESHP